MKLDHIDWQILHHLQNDGRMTNVELANRVGISAPPCLRRVRVLEEEGIIRGYHADVDPETLDFGVMAFVFVVLHNRTENDLKMFEHRISELSLVRECHLLVGDIDFLLKILAKTSEDYQKFLQQQLMQIDNIDRMTSALSVRRSKWFTGVPIDENLKPNKTKK